MAKSYDLTTETGTKEYLRDVEIEYQYQCFDQKEPDGCHRLAEFRESIRQNISAAVQLYKDTCDNYNYPKSCYKYGQWLDSGGGTQNQTPDLKAALQYYEKSCVLGFGNGCFNAAQIHIQTGEDKTKVLKALPLLSRACELKSAEGCFYTGALYLSGKFVEKDLTKAFQFYQKGCNVEHVGCCSNLGLMYQHGHGTEKNSKLAAEMKERALHFSIEHVKKQPVIKVNE